MCITWMCVSRLFCATWFFFVMWKSKNFNNTSRFLRNKFHETPCHLKSLFVGEKKKKKLVCDTPIFKQSHLVIDQGHWDHHASCSWTFEEAWSFSSCPFFVLLVFYIYIFFFSLTSCFIHFWPGFMYLFKTCAWCSLINCCPCTIKYNQSTFLQKRGKKPSFLNKI